MEREKNTRTEVLNFENSVKWFWKISKPHLKIPPRKTWSVFLGYQPDINQPVTQQNWPKSARIAQFKRKLNKEYGRSTGKKYTSRRQRITVEKRCALADWTSKMSLVLLFVKNKEGLSFHSLFLLCNSHATQPNRNYSTFAWLGTTLLWHSIMLAWRWKTCRFFEQQMRIVEQMQFRISWKMQCCRTCEGTFTPSFQRLFFPSSELFHFLVQFVHLWSVIVHKNYVHSRSILVLSAWHFLLAVSSPLQASFATLSRTFLSPLSWSS